MDTAALNRLRWRCTHRAMREMDVLLGGFLERSYPGLNPEQAAAFVALAEMEDTELWPLVVGRRMCSDPVQAELVAMMRNIGVRQDQAG